MSPLRPSLWFLGLVALGAAACSSKTDPIGAASALPVTIVRAAPLEVRLVEGGVSFAVDGVEVGSGCQGASGVTVPRANGAPQDLAPVTACARTLRADARLAAVATVKISAYPAAPYQDVMTLIDAVRGADGEIFSAIELGFPVGWPASARDVPDPPPLPPLPPQPPSRPAARTPSTGEIDGVVIRVTKTQLLVSDEVVATDFGDRTSLAENGLPVRYKRGRLDDTYIVPFARALAPYREDQMRIAAENGLGAATTAEAILVVDATTPYRLLFEVIHTLRQAGFIKHHLMGLKGR